MSADRVRKSLRSGLNNQIIFPSSVAIPLAAHQNLLKRLRDYFFIGGLPEAVLSFHEGQSLLDVSAVHRSIVSTYQDDFSKYAKQNDLLLLQKIFNCIPRSLGQKVKYTNISRNNRSAQVKKNISLLTKVRICHPIKHIHCSGDSTGSKKLRHCL